VVCVNCNKSSAVAEMGDRLATIDMDRKVGGGCCAPFRGGAGFPSNTVSPGTRPTCVYTKWYPDPSSRLAAIHQRYGQDRQDNGAVASGEPLLVTFAQKLLWPYGRIQRQTAVTPSCSEPQAHRIILFRKRMCNM